MKSYGRCDHLEGFWKNLRSKINQVWARFCVSFIRYHPVYISISFKPAQGKMTVLLKEWDRAPDKQRKTQSKKIWQSFLDYFISVSNWRINFLRGLIAKWWCNVSYWRSTIFYFYTILLRIRLAQSAWQGFDQQIGCSRSN